MHFHYSRPNLLEEDITEVVRVLERQFLSQGPIIEQLENKLQRLFSVKHAVVCNSGTAALHMAYNGIGLGQNAGLITSSVTFLPRQMPHICAMHQWALPMLTHLQEM